MPLIYFSTCSIEDPASSNSPYVAYKQSLEALLGKRKNYLIIRLPQVVGSVPNPYTLLNYLAIKIQRSERFELWTLARRNVIDIKDVAKIVLELVLFDKVNVETINIAATRHWTMLEIVTAIERVTGHTAHYDLVERGAEFSIDTSRIGAILDRHNIFFGDDYLSRVLKKYYGSERVFKIHGG